MKDYYKILGVEEEASEEEVRARWIELTKVYHPDLGKTEEGDEKIREINEAYETLKSESTRFHYDFERDLKRSFIKRAHRRQERETSLRKAIWIPSGIVVLFLIVGFLLLRSGRVASPPGPMAKTEVLDEIVDKGSEKTVASRTPPVEISSKAQSEEKAMMEIKEVAIPRESKKEVMPPESTERVSFRPPQSPSEVDRESERNKEPPRKILPESNVAKRVEKEVEKAIPERIPQERTGVASAPVPPPGKKESESKGMPAPQVVMKPQMPATKEVPGEVPKETPKPVTGEIPKQVPRETSNQVAREVSKEVPKDIPKEVPKEAPKEAAKVIPKEVAEEVPKEVPKGIPKEIPKEAPKEAAKGAAREVPKEVPKEVTKEVAKEVPKDIPKQVAKEIPKEPPKEAVKEVPKELPKEVSTATLHPGENLTIWTKGGKVVSSRASLLAKEEEVKQFFSNYVDRYHRRDVGGFLSLFSSRAIQNQTNRSEAIRNFYTKLFDQSQELRYQIEGMKIEISQYRVDVKARFREDQKLRKDGEDKVFKGNIRWVLVKEEGRLKIISMDY